MISYITYQKHIECSGTPKIIASGKTYTECMKNTISEIERFQTLGKKIDNVQILAINTFERDILSDIHDHDLQHSFIEVVDFINSDYHLSLAMSQLYDGLKSYSNDYEKINAFMKSVCYQIYKQF